MRANAVDIVSAFLALGGAVFCGLGASAFADASDLAGLFWCALGASSLSAAVQMTRRR